MGGSTNSPPYFSKYPPTPPLIYIQYISVINEWHTLIHFLSLVNPCKITLSPLSFRVMLKHVIHHCLSQWKLSTSDSCERLWATLNYSRYKAFISRDSYYSLWNLKLVCRKTNQCLPCCFYNNAYWYCYLCSFNYKTRYFWMEIYYRKEKKSVFLFVRLT